MRRRQREVLRDLRAELRQATTELLVHHKTRALEKRLAEANARVAALDERVRDSDERAAATAHGAATGNRHLLSDIARSAVKAALSLERIEHSDNVWAALDAVAPAPKEAK